MARLSIRCCNLEIANNMSRYLIEVEDLKPEITRKCKVRVESDDVFRLADVMSLIDQTLDGTTVPWMRLEY